MWKGSKLCQTILGLVSKLLHPLSVLLTIVLSWVLYHVAVCAIHIAPNSILWGFVKADVKQAEQQESALGLSMSWVMSGRACWNQFAYLRHIREKVMFDPRAWSWLIWKPIDATEVGIYCGPTEYIRGLCYKLRMRIGAKVDEPTNVFADNKSVLCNARAMASTLKKKQYALAYHFVQGGVARD